MYQLLILLIVFPLKLIGQETEVIKNTKVYLSSNASKDNVIGEIFPGSSITKLKKDKSGKFINLLKPPSNFIFLLRHFLKGAFHIQ